MIPYKLAKYNLKDFEECNPQPRSPEELFNLCQSSLRYVFGKSFELLERRFRILVEMVPYDILLQVKISIICCLIHNFIMMDKEHKDWLFESIEDFFSNSPAHTLPAFEPKAHKEARLDRETVANELWAAYESSWNISERENI